MNGFRHIVITIMALFAISFVLTPIVQAATANNTEAPMRFVIVRNASKMCEPVCPQWISAEGSITSATPAQLKKIIAKAGKLKLPIVIQSGGGEVLSAVQMGRMIRKSGLSVAVGWTLIGDNCKPASENCKLPPEQNGIYNGMVFLNGAYCNSACHLILAGGVQRMAGAGAWIGAHQVLTNWVKGDTVYFRERYQIINKKKKIISRKIVKRVKGKSYTTTGLYKGLRKQLTAYLNEMGVGLGLFDDMEKAPPSSLYWMPAEELEKLKLVNTKSSADRLLSFSGCKAYPVAPFCVFKIPTDKKI